MTAWAPLRLTSNMTETSAAGIHSRVISSLVTTLAKSVVYLRVIGMDYPALSPILLTSVRLRTSDSFVEVTSRDIEVSMFQ